jgi:small subunit ribosomal protein S2
VAQVGIKELLEAGVHFGHQTRRWNPKMRRFIFGERDGIYIIDLEQTDELLQQAQKFASDIARRGGTVMFVGTKKQARDAIKETAESAGMPYVNHRWLGGLLTNFQTISGRIKRLHDLERYETEGQLQLLPTRERMAAQADLEKLRANLGGVKNMQRQPDAVFVIDLKTEAIAVKEAQRLRIPIIGLVDTNCDPEGIDFVIPGNDDAIRSCAAITRAIGDVVSEAHGVFRAEEEKARLERERKEAEERARREAEEKARREAEEQARAEAEAKAKAEAEAAEAEARAAAAAEAANAAETLAAGEAAAAAKQESTESARAAAVEEAVEQDAAAGAAVESADPTLSETTVEAPAPAAPAQAAPEAPAEAAQPEAPAEAAQPEAPATEAQPEAPAAEAPAADAAPESAATSEATEAPSSETGAADADAELAPSASEAEAAAAPDSTETKTETPEEN